MTILYRNITANNARFPQPKRTGFIKDIIFPSDLVVDDRNFHMRISFLEYDFVGDIMPDVFTGGLSSSIQSGIDNLKALTSSAASFFNLKKSDFSFSNSKEIPHILLPLPKKINDLTTLSWSDESVLGKVIKLIPSETVRSAAVTGVEAIATSSFMTGVTINPFLFMFFQRPNFKEFVLQWTLTANSPKESETINRIIDSLQKASLPTKTGFGFLLKYPHVLEIEIFPDEFGQQMPFKLCAITAVQVDYTGAGMPSFFKDTNMPTVVTLSLSLKEIELWDSSEIEV